MDGGSFGGMRNGHINNPSMHEEKERDGERETEKLLTDVLEDVDDEKRCDQVVDALHVATGRVANGPDEQDPLENLSAHTKK